MAFTPRTVKDQIVEFPNRFKVDGVSRTIEPDFGIVIEPGTEINKAYLQPIEDALGEAVTKEELNSHKAETASTSQKGHVQLSTSTTSTSTTLAATASAVRAVRNMIPSLEGYARVATGSYVGNGGKNRLIAVGATPMFVFVSGNDAPIPGQGQTARGGTGISIESVNGIGSYGSATISRASSNTGAPQITTNGFTVSGDVGATEYGLNKSNITYRWLAFY